MDETPTRCAVPDCENEPTRTVTTATGVETHVCEDHIEVAMHIATDAGGAVIDKAMTADELRSLYKRMTKPRD